MRLSDSWFSAIDCRSSDSGKQAAAQFVHSVSQADHIGRSFAAAMEVKHRAEGVGITLSKSLPYRQQFAAHGPRGNQPNYDLPTERRPNCSPAYSTPKCLCQEAGE
jgi:hypothetical protein